MAYVKNGPDFFEGTEKLLEMWFGASEKGNENGDLRSIDRKDLEKILKRVRCEIISYSNNEDMDAYVLSESSMYITRRRFILKTCGTTTLLLAVKPLIDLVKDQCGLDSVDDVFYSRKKFSQPEKQHHIHQRFEAEVELLDELFENSTLIFPLIYAFTLRKSAPAYLRDGAAYTLGRINRDCWYLYTIDNEKILEPDQTFELLMWDMDQDKMKIFTMDNCSNAKEATEKSGTDKILPGVLIDDVLFEPCGYSMNGLLPGGYYITIHVTPEPHCSYVSFESNVPQESYSDLTKKVLETFNPGKFLMTLFANKVSAAKNVHRCMEHCDTMDSYIRLDHQFCKFKNYNLTYTYFVRPFI